MNVRKKMCSKKCHYKGFPYKKTLFMWCCFLTSTCSIIDKWNWFRKRKSSSTRVIWQIYQYHSPKNLTAWEVWEIKSRFFKLFICSLLLSFAHLHTWMLISLLLLLLLEELDLFSLIFLIQSHHQMFHMLLWFLNQL